MSASKSPSRLISRSHAEEATEREHTNTHEREGQRKYLRVISEGCIALEVLEVSSTVLPFIHADDRIRSVVFITTKQHQRKHAFWCGVLVSFSNVMSVCFVRVQLCATLRL